MANGWTTYQDWLMNEAIALMTEPNWYSQTEITDRLSTIRTALDASAEDLGKTPIVDSNGDPVLDGSGNPTYETADERMNRILIQFESAHEDANAANESRYTTLIGDPVDLPNYPTIAADALADYLSPALTGFASSVSAMPSDATLTASYNTAIDSAFGTTGFMTAIEADYQTRETAALELLSAAGTLQRTENEEKADAEFAAADWDLTSRGLGNSTIRSVVKSGIRSREARELLAINESLNQQELSIFAQLSSERLGVAAQNAATRTTWLGEQLSALERNRGITAQLQNSLDQARMTVGGVMAELWSKALQTVEARSDVAPTLADIVNVSMQIGRGAASQFAIPGMSPITTYQIDNNPDQ